MGVASKRFMNWTGVSFTPAIGNAINFTGVQSVSIDSGGSIAKYAGDGDRYNSLMVNDFNEPSISVSCGDLAAVNACPTGTVGTFTATHNDAKNGAGTGAVTYTMLAIVDKESRGGKHRAFGDGNISFMGYSADGVTNPLSTSTSA